MAILGVSLAGHAMAANGPLYFSGPNLLNANTVGLELTFPLSIRAIMLDDPTTVSTGPQTSAKFVAKGNVVYLKSISTTLQSVSADGSPGNITQLSLSGSFAFSIPNNEFSSSGGNLSFSNLSVDLTKRTMYADISGANGYGTRQQVALFNVGKLAGTTTLKDGTFTSIGPVFDRRFNCYIDPPHRCPISETAPDRYGLDANYLQLSLTDMKLTQEGMEAFSQGLGLLEPGVFSLNNRSFSATLQPVPEPNGQILAAIGLVALLAVSRRRACRAKG